MKALVTEPAEPGMPPFPLSGPLGKTARIDVDEPKISPQEVLVKIGCSSICFTDLHAYLGVSQYYGAVRAPVRPGNGFARANAPALSGASQRSDKGHIAGHEAGGVIVEIGADVPSEANLHVGDRICVDIFAAYEGPYPAAGINFGTGVAPQFVLPSPRAHSGLYAEYAAVNWHAAVKIPPQVSDVAAAAVEPWACGTRCARHSGQVLGDNVVVFGFDDYTASAMAWSKRLSPNDLIVVDALPVRREGALAFGADHVVDPTAEDPVVAIWDRMPVGADVVYVAVDEWLEPSHRNIQHAFESVRLGGTVVITRLYRPDAFQYIDAMDFWSREVTVKTFGSFWCDEMWRGGRNRGDWMLTIDGMARGWIDPDAYAAKVIPFDELKTAEDVDRAFKAQLRKGERWSSPLVVMIHLRRSHPSREVRSSLVVAPPSLVEIEFLIAARMVAHVPRMRPWCPASLRPARLRLADGKLGSGSH